MMALALTTGAQGQPVDDSLDAIKAAMIAAKVQQDSIDTSKLVAVYDYECRTQDAEGKAVTDRMKVCVQVGQHSTRSFPFRKYRKEREWAKGEQRAATDFLRLTKQEFMEGYDFGSIEERPLLCAESFCFMPQVWTGYPKGQVTVRDAIPPTIYETREEFEPIKWEAAEGFATCQLHGRCWKVRYDEKILTTAGPWKLGGLPGLIIEAESDDGVHRFKLVSVEYVVTPIYYENSAITVKTIGAKLIENRWKTFGNTLYANNPLFYIDDYSIADKVYAENGTMINGYFVNNKAHAFQPLELE